MQHLSCVVHYHRCSYSSDCYDNIVHTPAAFELAAYIYDRSGAMHVQQYVLLHRRPLHSLNKSQLRTPFRRADEAPNFMRPLSLTFTSSLAFCRRLAIQTFPHQRRPRRKQQQYPRGCPREDFPRFPRLHRRYTCRCRPFGRKYGRTQKS